MTQQEFTERTKITISGDKYEEVQAIYANVKMDKDDFCAEWKKLRNNPLLDETGEAMLRISRENAEKDSEIRQLKALLEQQKQQNKMNIEALGKQAAEIMEEFAKKMILCQYNADEVRNIIEEEFGLPFIIKEKRAAHIALNEDEIDYLVSKL